MLKTPQCLPVEFAVYFSTILLQPFILIVSSLDLNAGRVTAGKNVLDGQSRGNFSDRL